jgi:hypothetical protein
MATNAQLYNTAYFSTHQDLLNQSIKLAEKEFVTLADRIQLLEGKIADYEKAIATGTNITKGGLKISESEVTGRLRVQEARRQNQAKELTAVEKSAEKSFDISRFNMPDVRNTMQAKIRSGAAVTRAVDDAINNVGGKGAGKDQVQKYVLAKSILQSAKSAATAQGQPYNEKVLRDQIASGMGIDGNVMLLSDEKIVQRVTQPKKDAINEKYAKMPKLADIKAKPGDIERMTDERDETAIKLKILEDQMRDQYGDDVDLGKIIERGREIYSQQYAPLTRKQRKELRKMKTAENLSPTARTNYEAYTSVRDNDSYYNRKDRKLNYKLFDEENNEDKIAIAARRIIEGKNSGNETDVRRLARELTDTPEQARAALGLAMHYFVENVETGLIPNLEKMVEKVEETSDEKAALNEASEEQGVSADSIKRTAEKVIPEVNPDFPSEADVEFDESGGTINRPGAEPAKVEKKDSFFDKLFSGRLFKKKEEVISEPEQKLEPVPLEEQNIPDEFKPAEPQGVDPALLQSQGVEVPVIPGPQIGDFKPYKPGGKMGYKLSAIGADGTRQYIYVNAAGKELPSTPISPKMFEDAEGLFNTEEGQ